MTTPLELINQTKREEAESIFRDCCGSTEWAQRMAGARPFASENELIETAAGVWSELETADWLQAFSAHPKIGETEAAPGQQTRSAQWSSVEQGGMSSADESLRRELADANREYYTKFGFIFIVCATGKTAEEMLDICRERLKNDREKEIGIAAAEQQKITEIRLRKLLSQ